MTAVALHIAFEAADPPRAFLYLPLSIGIKIRGTCEALTIAEDILNPIVPINARRLACAAARLTKSVGGLRAKFALSFNVSNTCLEAANSDSLYTPVSLFLFHASSSFLSAAIIALLDLSCATFRFRLYALSRNAPKAS